MEPEDAEEAGVQALASGAPIEDALRIWRSRGLSVLRSIQCLSHATGMSLTAAKGVVHNSGTWRDLRDEHDRVHDIVEDIGREPTR